MTSQSHPPSSPSGDTQEGRVTPIGLINLHPRFRRYEERIEPHDYIVGDEATWRERGCPTQRRTVPTIYHVRVDTLAEARSSAALVSRRARSTTNMGRE